MHDNIRPFVSWIRLTGLRRGARTWLQSAVKRVKAHPRTRRIGVALERGASYAIIARSGLVDAEWYNTQLGPKASLSRLRATVHYVLVGRARGLSPHPLFEPEYFDPLDWRRTNVDPFARYLHNRESWRTAPHPLFDGEAYLAATPEAGRHRFGPLGHFLASARPDTTLPLPGPLDHWSGLTWKRARERLLRSMASHTHQERLRSAPRVTTGYNRKAEKDFVGHWSEAPLPRTPPGDPLVSVILPVRNRADRLRAAIASVRAQSMTAWELLVVDDGSVDASAEVAEAIAAEDPRIKVIRQRRAGMCRARNAAIERARGRHLAFLDPDHTYRPQYLRTALASMHGQGWRLAYAVMCVRTGQKPAYRALKAGRPLLEVANHVDLNVLVAERTLVVEVGLFDESLRRGADYDLVLRMDRVHPVRFMPFVGADRNPAADVGSNPEPESWLEVVQNKNLVDWPAQGERRVPGRTSILIPTHQDWQLTQRCLESILGCADEEDIEVVVLDNGSRRSASAILAAICAADPRLHHVRQPLNRNFGLGCNLAFARSTGETAVFLNNDTEVQAGWLSPLRRTLDETEVLGVQPLLLHPNGTVQCAGVVFPPRGTLPVQFLAHHPAGDAYRVGRSFAVSAVTGAALAMRASDVTALRGFDPIFRNGWEDVDLCLRLQLRRPGRFEVRTDSVVVHHLSRTPGRHDHTPLNRKLFHDRWMRRVPAADEHLWRAAGFEVAHYREDSGSAVEQPGVARPVLVRPAARVIEGPATGLPAFRWALKIAAPAGPAGLPWGDLHFARSLAKALERLGQTVVIDSYGSHRRASSYLDDVVLVLRGLVPVMPLAGRRNLMWVISHPDRVGVEEVARYDLVFAAGGRWAARLSALVDVPVEPLLQCTDPERFHPGVAAPDSGEPVVFVGNSRKVFRPVVRDAVAAGVPVAVYGSMWEQFLDARHIRGLHLPNDQVPATYRSAGVLLSDHWEDMRREGFVSNRLFDAAATGARILSDDVPGMKEIFGGLVRTYDGVEELKEILGRPPREAFPNEADRLLLAAHVREVHSFDVRARTLLDAAARL